MSASSLVAPMGHPHRVGPSTAQIVYSQASTMKRAGNNENAPPAAEPAAKRRKYKTTMEEVRVKKKPLELKYDTNVPLDYKLVKYGRAEITTFLLNLSRKHKCPVWVANSTLQSQRPEAQAHDTSRSGYHVGRVGFYFYKDLVEKAEKWFEIRIEAGNITADKNSRRPQLTNKDLKACLGEIYPHIPERDRDSIIRRLNPKNGSSIGKASNLNPYKQVELAVISHIRHAHTDYDKLLRYGNKHEARKAIQPELLAKLAEWKGEDDRDEYDTDFKEVVDLDNDAEEVLDEDDENYSPPLPQGWFEPRRSTETPGIPSRPSTRHPEVEQLNPKGRPSGNPSTIRFGTQELQNHPFSYQPPLPPPPPPQNAIDLTHSSPIRPGAYGSTPSSVIPRHASPPVSNQRRVFHPLTYEPLSPTGNAQARPPPPMRNEDMPLQRLPGSVRLIPYNADDHRRTAPPPPPPPDTWDHRRQVPPPPPPPMHGQRVDAARAPPAHSTIQWRQLPPVKPPTIHYRPLPPSHDHVSTRPSEMRYRPLSPDHVLPSKEPHSPPSNPRSFARPSDWDDYYSPH